MPIEYAAPKYVTIVNTMQARIEDGTYASGVMLPSETVLMGEFKASRPTVVRALEILRQDGWINSQQGRGRFVSAKPTGRQALLSQVDELLAVEAAEQVSIVEITDVTAKTLAAAALGIAEDTTVSVRRCMVILVLEDTLPSK